MPHWGLKMNLPEQLLAAISAALEDDFHPGDTTGCWPSAGPSACSVLASRVEAVLAEARQEAGDDPVDPKLLLTLTEALAATFDPGYH